ncbi:unnamed protein product [Amoebophrya sp. A25]|nr:unnamed protein product [Amoebophrya sp. A25]|eukprot:GSA25T00017831001.1
MVAASDLPADEWFLEDQALIFWASPKEVLEDKLKGATKSSLENKTNAELQGEEPLFVEDPLISRNSSSHKMWLRFPALPWKRWAQFEQKHCPNGSAVNVLALACVLCDVYTGARNLLEAKKRCPGIPCSTLGEALEIRLQAYKRLWPLPKEYQLGFEKTTIEAIYAELFAPAGELGEKQDPLLAFFCSSSNDEQKGGRADLKISPATLEDIAGSDQRGRDLISAATLEDIAGRLSQNILGAAATTASSTPSSDLRSSSIKAVFSLLSLCNHSCDPNVDADIQINPENSEVSAKLTTRRPARKGESLTISYVDFDSESVTFQERRKVLEHWNFVCQCEKCVREEKEHLEREGNNDADPEDEDAKTKKRRKLESPTLDDHGHGVKVPVKVSEQQAVNVKKDAQLALGGS